MNAGSDKRLLGLDCTFGAPKSFSVAWALADPSTQKRLEATFDTAIRNTIPYLEQNASFVRQGKGGEHITKAGLVVAVYHHYTNRNLEPHVHAHCLVVNLGVQDEKTNSLVSPLLYEHKMDAGAIFRAELAHALETDLGLNLERKNEEYFEIQGIPANLMDAFSTRRQQIERVLEKRGLSSAKAASIATLATRPKKCEANYENLRFHWQNIGRSYGFDADRVTKLIASPFVDYDRTRAREELISAVQDRLRSLPDFTATDLIRAIALEATGRGLDGASIESLANTFLASSVVQVSQTRRETRYTLPSHSKAISSPLLEPHLESEEFDLEWEPEY